MKQEGVLNLTVIKKWFDMEKSGEKPEEYREIKKYWVQRLMNGHEGVMGGDLMDLHKVKSYTFKKFEYVRITNGYRKDSPSELYFLKSIEIREGRVKWGAEKGKLYFVLNLGIRI